MTFNEYQKEAMRTASGVCAATSENLILNGVMGLNGEAGEAIDMVKRLRSRDMTSITSILQRNLAIFYGILRLLRRELDTILKQ